MAKKNEDKDENKKKKSGAEGEMAEGDDDDDSGLLGKLIMLFVAILIIAIWLAIFAILVKMDVGGFGSTVLYPVLKDVPYVNQILPEVKDYAQEDEKYRFETVDDAVVRIKELEAQLSTIEGQNSANSSYVTELETAAKELADFKANQQAFEKNKEKFYEEVVFSNYSPDIEEYKKYYESIEPANAEAIYKQVVAQLQNDEKLKDYVTGYSSMKPAAAAAIFNTMTNDLKLVAKILKNMDADSRGKIMAAMDASIAAQLTEIMEPSSK